MKFLYWLTSLIYQPFAPVHLLLRKSKGKELAGRYREKLGFYTIKRPSGKLIWFHVASIGELNSIIPLIKALSESDKKLYFLITSVTVSSSKVFARANLLRTIHQFAPLDCPAFVKRFINYWKPNLGVFVDSELWPNLLATASTQCKLIMVNGRLSDKSYRRWCYLKNAAQQLYDYFTRIFPTSIDDLNKISAFVSRDKIKYIGNLKYIAPASSVSDEAKNYRKQIGKRKFWLAASMHPGEFSQILKVHAQLKNQYPDLLTIIMPRHSHNARSIADEAKRMGLIANLRSQAPTIDKSTEVYIFDDFLMLYDIAEIVFMGGSLIPHGGQNMLEPARSNCAIIVGPHTQNFRNIVEELVEAEGIAVVHDMNALQEKLTELFSNNEILVKLAHNAKKVSDQQNNILTDTLKAIKVYI